MSTFGTSESGAGAITWRLAQTLWVGGVWTLQFLVLPALAERSGLAPLLVEEAAASLRPLMIGLAAVCAALQALVLVRALGLPSLWRDLRGQGLLCVARFSAVFLAIRGEGDTYWPLFAYMAVAVLGLVLVLQPPPGRAGR